MKRGWKPKDVDDYIAAYPGERGRRLERIRRAVHKAVPGATEKISYDIPTIAVDGKNLLYFAAFADHLSVYPAPRGAPAFADELKRYAGGKGTLQLPHDEAVPYDLIARIARHHLERIRGGKATVSKRTGTKSLAKKAPAKKSPAKKSPAKKAGAKKSTSPRKGKSA